MIVSTILLLLQSSGLRLRLRLKWARELLAEVKGKTNSKSKSETKISTRLDRRCSQGEVLAKLVLQLRHHIIIIKLGSAQALLWLKTRIWWYQRLSQYPSTKSLIRVGLQGTLSKRIIFPIMIVFTSLTRHAVFMTLLAWLIPMSPSSPLINIIFQKCVCAFSNIFSVGSSQ